MIFPKMANAAATFAVLWAFCFATAFSSDVSISLRGSRDLSTDHIDVYRCDAYNQRISSTITNKTEELSEGGFDVRICFEATRQATSNNLYILKIDDFSFTKDRTNGDLAAAGPTRNLPPILRQKSVDHGLPLSNDITRMYCSPGEDVCAIETRLTGYFFLTSGPIMGKGSVLMQLGDTTRRELQDIRNFEDVYIEINFTGGGRSPLPPQQKRIIIIGSVIGGVILAVCCCGVIFCCLAGLCCFAGTRRERDEYYEEEEEGIEEVSVRMEKYKKGEEDMSETESLEDDKYWDDDLAISDDEDDPYTNDVNVYDEDVILSEDENNPDDDFSEDLETAARTVPVVLPAPPFQEEEEEEEVKTEKKPRRQSRRSSSKSLKKEIAEDLYDTEEISEELFAIPDPEETPRKKKKKKKEIGELEANLLLSPEETPRTKKKKKKKLAESVDDLMLSPEETPRTKKKKKKKLADQVGDLMLSPEETPRTKKKKKKRPSATFASLEPPIE